MNIRKFYIYKFFFDLMPVYPIYALLIENAGLSVTEISLLLAIWSVPLLILEVPSGILADFWSRKYLIAISGFLKAACYLIWSFAEGFSMFAAGFILWGISSSFHSGAEEALLYDSLLACKRENEYDKILGRCRALSGISIVLASVSGGFIWTYFGSKAPLYLSVIFALISAITALSFREVNFYKNADNKKHHKAIKNGIDTFRDAASFLVKSRKILIFTLLSITVIGMAGIVDEYDPLIAKEYGLSMGLIGIWVGIRFIFCSFGSYIAYFLKYVCRKIFKAKDIIFIISLICITANLSLFAAGLIKHLWVMGLYGMYFLLLSAAEVLQEDYIQQNIGEEGRSTVHSLLSLASSTYGILACFLLGAVLKAISIHEMLVVLSIYGISLIILLCLLFIWTKPRVKY